MCQDIVDMSVCQHIVDMRRVEKPMESPERLRPLGGEIPLEGHRKAVPGHVDRGDHMGVFGFRGHEEPLAEDIQPSVAADEPHQAVAAGLRLRQRDGRWGLRRREAQRTPVRLQRDERGLTAEPRVTVPAVVPLLEPLSNRPPPLSRERGERGRQDAGGPGATWR